MNKLFLLSLLLVSFHAHSMDSTTPERASKKQCRRSFSIPLKDHYLNYIKAGKKTIEGRIYKGAFGKMQAGNIIEFFSSKNSVTVKVDQVNVYSDFEAMINTESLSEMLPEMRDTDQKKAIELYRSFPGYRNLEKKYGVVAIHISLLKNN